MIALLVIGIVAISATALLVWSGRPTEVAGDAKILAPVLAPSDRPPTPPPTPPTIPTREDAARPDLDRARAYAKANPEDLTGRLKQFTEIVWKWEGTDVGREAAKEAAAVKALILDKVHAWMAEVEAAIKEQVEAKQYLPAAAKVESMKASHDLPEWRLAVEKRASELFVLARRMET